MKFEASLASRIEPWTLKHWLNFEWFNLHECRTFPVSGNPREISWRWEKCRERIRFTLKG